MEMHFSVLMEHEESCVLKLACVKATFAYAYNVNAIFYFFPRELAKNIFFSILRYGEAFSRETAPSDRIQIKKVNWYSVISERAHLCHVP